MRFQSHLPLPFLFLIPALASADSPPDTRTLLINNKCSHPIWPGILTSNGTSTSAGFHLPSISNQSVTVSWDWIGRVWGRTNCTFDETTKLGSCLTGDCGGKLECQLAGVPPTTLAEFTISGKDSQTFFDVSLVDGYDLDMSIVPEHDGPDKPRKDNSPVCVMSTPEDDRAITHWCPFDLLIFPPPKKPRNSVAFWYPDDNLQRPLLSPCLSACAKWNKPQDCCIGEWNDPKKCGPSLYSRKAKKVCPDAYSYAYDDLLSTFTVPTGKGFEITFCPGGVSSDIMANKEQSSGAEPARSRAAAVVVAAAAAMLMVGLL